MDQELVEVAAVFAENAHAGQLRKDTDEPYFTHSKRVADLVRFYTRGNLYAIAAAYLHHVVEDTSITPDTIHKAFGTTVYNYVGWLTEMRGIDGNSAERRAFERGRLHCAPGIVQTIKVCDLIDNIESNVMRDPGCEKIYLEEQQRLLLVMSRANPIALRTAEHQVHIGLKQISVTQCAPRATTPSRLPKSTTNTATSFRCG